MPIEYASNCVSEIAKYFEDKINRQKAEIDYLKKEVSNLDFLNKELAIDKKNLLKRNGGCR